MGENSATDKLTKFTQQRKLYDKESSKESARNRLKTMLKKKMTTILVGCVARIEEEMGNLWAHGVYSQDKTDAELDLTVVWKMCRDKMFDLGNAQIRAMEKELNGYAVEVLREHTQFRV